MNIFEGLSLLGLQKNEIRIYLYVLANGISSPSQIAKGTKIARTNSYHLLQSLVERDLLEEHTTGKRKAYIAKDPAALKHDIERKSEIIERIVPDLRGIYTTKKNKPQVKFYDGEDQLKELYKLTLETEKIRGIGALESLERTMPGLLAWYGKALKKRKLLCRIF